MTPYISKYEVLYHISIQQEHDILFLVMYKYIHKGGWIPFQTSSTFLQQITMSPQTPLFQGLDRDLVNTTLSIQEKAPKTWISLSLSLLKDPLNKSHATP